MSWRGNWGLLIQRFYRRHLDRRRKRPLRRSAGNQGAPENPRVDSEHEFFNGAPVLGHWPVFFDIDLKKPNSNRKLTLDYKKANWNIIADTLELVVTEKSTDLCRLFPSCLLNSFMEIVDDICTKQISTKCITEHSKPYWNQRLSALSLKIKKARPKLLIQKKFGKTRDSMGPRGSFQMGVEKNGQAALPSL